MVKQRINLKSSEPPREGELGFITCYRIALLVNLAPTVSLFLIVCLYFCQLYPHCSIAFFLIACLYLCQSCIVLFVSQLPPFLSGWASRVYYSDNGSTAIEIALKMAFRKFSLDHGILADSEKSIKKERNIQLKVCYWHTKHPWLPCLFLSIEL